MMPFSEDFAEASMPRDALGDDEIKAISKL
jgi:hypothetical protein